MSWAEIKKAVNSDLSTPLNSKIDAQTTSLNSKIDTQTTTLAKKFGWTLESDSAYGDPQVSFSKNFDGIGFFTRDQYNNNNAYVKWQIGYAYIAQGIENNFFPIKKNETYYAHNCRLLIYKLGGVCRKLTSLVMGGVA